MRSRTLDLSLVLVTDTIPHPDDPHPSPFSFQSHGPRRAHRLPVAHFRLLAGQLVAHTPHTTHLTPHTTYHTPHTTYHTLISLRWLTNPHPHPDVANPHPPLTLKLAAGPQALPHPPNHGPPSRFVGLFRGRIPSASRRRGASLWVGCDHAIA